MKNSLRQMPVTITLIAICVGCYLWTVVQGGSTNLAVLIHSGAKDTPLILQGQWWRLLTAGFLQIGIQH